MGKNITVLGLAILGLALLIIAGFGFMAGPTTYWAWIAVILLASIPWLHGRLVQNAYLTWQDSYSVGIQTLDDDHKRLLHLINNLYTAAHYRTDMAFERQALNEVIDYTKTHFAREEELMRVHAYPDFEAHQRQHQAMIAKVNQLVGRYEQDRDGTVEDLLTYLREWLIQHILGTDQQYRAHLTASGAH